MKTILAIVTTLLTVFLLLMAMRVYVDMRIAPLEQRVFRAENLNIQIAQQSFANAQQLEFIKLMILSKPRSNRQGATEPRGKKYASVYVQLMWGRPGAFTPGPIRLAS